MFKFIFWFTSTIVFYTYGWGTGGTHVAQTTPNYDANGVYYSQAVKDSAVAHWDTLVFYGGTPTYAASSLSYSVWTASQTRTDSFKLYVNNTYIYTKVLKTTEALGSYSADFTSAAVYPENIFKVIVHVKAGGSGTTLIKLRPKIILQ